MCQRERPHIYWNQSLALSQLHWKGTPCTCFMHTPIMLEDMVSGRKVQPVHSFKMEIDFNNCWIVIAVFSCSLMPSLRASCCEKNRGVLPPMETLQKQECAVRKIWHVWNFQRSKRKQLPALFCKSSYYGGHISAKNGLKSLSNFPHCHSASNVVYHSCTDLIWNYCFCSCSSSPSSSFSLYPTSYLPSSLQLFPPIFYINLHLSCCLCTLNWPVLVSSHH